MSMNHESAPLDDVTVRKALMVAVDRDRIIQVMEQGEGFPQYGQVVRALPFYDQAFEDESATMNAYDPDKAISLLAEAGWEKDSDGLLKKNGEALEFNFIQTGSERNVRMGSLLQAQLQEIGITVNLETLESATHGSRRKEGDFDLRHSGYATLTADILSFFWHPNESSNLDRITDQTFAKPPGQRAQQPGPGEGGRQSRGAEVLPGHGDGHSADQPQLEHAGQQEGRGLHSPQELHGLERERRLDQERR